jgi:hypothetical protein
MNFERAAAAAGWELDTSPATENSNDVWYRHGGTFQLKREEELRDELTFDEHVVDMTTCKPGQKLLLRNGEVAEYVGPNKDGCTRAYPHLIKYSNGSLGTRTDDGYVFAKKQLPVDPDVIKIL